MGILARLRLAKMRTMARPNSPDMPPKRTKKVRLGIFISDSFAHRCLLVILAALKEDLYSGFQSLSLKVKGKDLFVLIKLEIILSKLFKVYIKIFMKKIKHYS